MSTVKPWAKSVLCLCIFGVGLTCLFAFQDDLVAWFPAGGTEPGSGAGEGTGASRDDVTPPGNDAGENQTTSSSPAVTITNVTFIFEYGNGTVERRAGLSYTGSEPNPYTLMQEICTVEVEEFEFGVLVTSINGLAQDGTRYWHFWHNGVYSNVGISSAPLASNDVFYWKYQ